MFEVVLDTDVLERLAFRLELWSGDLSNHEWAHLVGLLGLASAALFHAIGDVAGSEPLDGRSQVAMMATPGFADALSPATDVVSSQAAQGRSVMIASGRGASLWAVSSSVRRAGG